MAVQPSENWKKKHTNWKNWGPSEPSQYGNTAKKVAETNEFLAACEKLLVNPSVRQARDYRRRLGRFAALAK